MHLVIDNRKKFTIDSVSYFKNVIYNIDITVNEFVVSTLLNEKVIQINK